MAARFGLALILIGVIVLTVFLLAFSIGKEDAQMLLLGAGLSALGLILRVRGRRAEHRGPRYFRTLRRFAGEDAEDVDSEDEG